jgi:hypothetical protein
LLLYARSECIPRSPQGSSSCKLPPEVTPGCALKA